jgi:hypothetical protein
MGGIITVAKELSIFLQMQFDRLEEWTNRERSANEPISNIRNAATETCRANELARRRFSEFGGSALIYFAFCASVLEV